jgi:hypothetical protein
VDLRVARTLCALAVLSACACGLEKGGLLEFGDAGDPGPGMDAAILDRTTADEPAPAESGPGGGDAPDDLSFAQDAGDARLDGGGDGRGDASMDARADAPRDARPPGDARDAPSDALDAAQGADAADGADADASDATGATDAPNSHPLPIVWDGGPIADPQFSDSAWIMFCNHLVGCGVMSSVNGCMAQLQPPFSPDALIPPPQMVQDVNMANSNCPALAQALGGGATCSSTTADSCSGNALVTCRFGFTMTIDCTSLGMVCSNGSANAGCGFGDCSPLDEGQTYCVGTTYVAQCTSGRYQPKLDCSLFGASCIGPDGTAQCQGMGSNCAAGPEVCVGTSIVECMAGNQGAIDCAAAYDPAFSCLVDDAGTPVCAAGTACDPATTPDTCATDTLVSFCNAGVTATYNCSSFWNACDGGHCTL